MRARRHRFLLMLAILLLVGWGLLRFSFRSTSPYSNVPYITWKMGIGRFDPSYAWMIGKDQGFWDNYLGKPIEELRKDTGLTFHDGSSFPLSSYRGKYWYYNNQRSPETSFLFFDSDKQAWGYCVIVVDGKITGYGLAREQ